MDELRNRLSDYLPSLFGDTAPAIQLLSRHPDQFPPLLIHSRCSTFLNWYVAALEERWYGAVAKPSESGEDGTDALLGTRRSDTHCVFSSDDGGEALVRRLMELTSCTGIAFASSGRKRSIIVLNLHRVSPSNQLRLKRMLDRSLNCTFVFTCISIGSIAEQLHSRFTKINCNPLKARWPDALARIARVVPSDPVVTDVMSDQRCTDIVSAVLLLEHRQSHGSVPKDIMASYLDSVLDKLTARNTTLAQAHSVVRQTSRLMCQYHLPVSEMARVMLSTASHSHNIPLMHTILQLSAATAPDKTQRHILVACETFLWTIYATAQTATTCIA